MKTVYDLTLNMFNLEVPSVGFSKFFDRVVVLPDADVETLPENIRDGLRVEGGYFRL